MEKGPHIPGTRRLPYNGRPVARRSRQYPGCFDARNSTILGTKGGKLITYRRLSLLPVPTLNIAPPAAIDASLIRNHDQCSVCSTHIGQYPAGLWLLPYRCAGDRESSANAFFPTGNAVEQGAEYGDDVSYWDDTRSAGKPKIVIDLNEQRAYFYRGNRMVGVSIVSNGREGYDTPSGEFRVTEKDPTHVSSIYVDYVDRSGQVVMENVDVTKDKHPPGTVFRRRTDAIFPQNPWEHRYARRLSAWLSSLTWMHTAAKGNGGPVL
jgi:hypothetical protein